MRASIRALIAGAVAGGALAVMPAAHATVTWTVVPTGTGDDITAVDYTSSRIVFATANGRIFSGPPSGPFTLQLDQSMTGGYFTDVAISPNGQQALAVGWNDGNGVIYSQTSPTGGWTFESLTTYDTNGVDPGIGNCLTSPGVTTPAPPTKALTGVSWASDTEAYATGLDVGVIWKGGPGSFGSMGRKVDGTCLANAVITDVVATAPGVAWFADQNFGKLWRTTNGLASAPSPGPEMVNAYSDRFSIAADPTSPNRVAIVNDTTPGGLNWGYSPNGGVTDDYVDLASGGNTPALHSVSAYGGSFIAVGLGGAILRSVNGGAAEAIGDGTTTEWFDVDMISATQAVAVGTGGRLIITNEAADPAGPEAPGGGGGTGSPLSADGSVPVVGGAATVVGPWVVVKVKGKLGLPAGVSAKAGCKGVVKLTLKKSGKTLAKAKAKVKRSCVYKKQIRVPRSKVGGAKLLRLNLKLTKNKTLGKVKSAYPVGIKQK